jgi:GT2 family glycosyltransferase
MTEGPAGNWREDQTPHLKEPCVVVMIPAFNEEKTIGRIVLQARKYADMVVVCDDGSSDLTAEIAQGLGADVIRHKENRGYGATIQSLFERAKELGADVVVTVDGDGQHDPKEIPTLLDPILRKKKDIVIGSRFLKRQDGSGIPSFRRFGINAITKLTDVLSEQTLSDAQSGFRAYKTEALDALSLSENGMGLSVEILVQAKKHGLMIEEVPASCKYDGIEKSSKTNPLRQGLEVVMSLLRLVVEEHPLMLLGIPGIVSLAVGMFFGIWMLEVFTTQNRIVTNIALAAAAFTIIGLFAIFTSITLYSISRLLSRKNPTRK